MNPPGPDVNDVLSRLRELQGRLSSLEQPTPARGTTLPSSVDTLFARQMFELQNLRDAMKSCQERQAQLFLSSSEWASAIGPEMGQIIQRKLEPRMNSIFERASRESIERSARVTADRLAERIESRLSGMEQRFKESIQEFATLQRNSVATELAVLKAAERLDTIWDNQDAEGIGAWRITMRELAATVGWEKYEPRTGREQFAAESGEEKSSHPPIAGLICPKCEAEEVRRLARESFLEELLRVVFVAPYRCRSCGERFYRMRARIGR